jgi:hypothetical protein
MLAPPRPLPLEQQQQQASPPPAQPPQQLPLEQQQQASPSPAQPLQQQPLEQQQQALPPPAPLAQVQQQIRKRPAAAVSACATLTFDAIWEHPADFRRHGVFGSLADLLRLMGSSAAKRAAGRPGEKVGVWSRRWDWTEHTHYESEVAEFCNRFGGGLGGMGLNKEAAQQVYAELSKS